MPPYHVEHTPKTEEWSVMPLGSNKSIDAPYREKSKPDSVCINVMAPSSYDALRRAEMLLESYCFASIFPSCHSILVGKLWRKDLGQI